MRAIGRATTILALCLSLGFHWLALQSVAWTTMLLSNACHVSLREAVAKTFDGAHPCNLCHAVADGKKSENKSEVVPTIVKMDLICVTRALPWLPPSVRYEFAPFRVSIPDYSPAPPSPPPRGWMS